MRIVFWRQMRENISGIMISQKGVEADFLWSEFCWQSKYGKLTFMSVLTIFFCWDQALNTQDGIVEHEIFDKTVMGWHFNEWKLSLLQRYFTIYETSYHFKWVCTYRSCTHVNNNQISTFCEVLKFSWHVRQTID